MVSNLKEEDLHASATCDSRMGSLCRCTCYPKGARVHHSKLFSRYAFNAMLLFGFSTQWRLCYIPTTVIIFICSSKISNPTGISRATGFHLVHNDGSEARRNIV